jgi:two-component system nitrate/nitrite response regulator NarL
VWLRRWLRASGRSKHLFMRRGKAAQPARPAREDAASANGRLVFEVDPELSAELRLAARAHDKPPEALVNDLLTRGLEREARRAQAEAALALLTPREQEIAWLTARGHTNHQIAKALVISSETVKTHIRHVLDKFGVRSKTDLRLLLLDLGVRWWEG